MPTAFKDASPLLKVVVVGSLIFGVVFALTGVWLVYMGATGETELRLFGQVFRSVNVGIAAVFIGGVTTVIMMRRAFRTIEAAIATAETAMGAPQVSTGALNLMQLIKDFMDVGGHLQRLAESLESTYEAMIRIHGKRVKRSQMRGLQFELDNLHFMILSRFRVIEALEHYIRCVWAKVGQDEIESCWSHLRAETQQGADLIHQLERFINHHRVPDPDPLELQKLMTATMRLYKQLPDSPPIEPSDLAQLHEIAGSLRVILESLRRIANIHGEL